MSLLDFLVEDKPILVVSPPEKRSSQILDEKIEHKALFTKKELSATAKAWLTTHDVSNWKDMELIQGYQTKQKNKSVFRELRWTLPGIEEKKEDCGKWLRKGCFNLKCHPDHKAHVIQTKKSCFRAKCEYCWLEKWLARESTRATRRIEKYSEFWKDMNTKHLFERRKYLKPIHVIVSPPWKEKFMRFDLLKKKTVDLLKLAGIEGGLLIYHPFGTPKANNPKWTTRPHFHVVGFGWVVVPKKISKEGWVIKNKGTRESLHSTIYYQLSHAGVSDGVHSVTWFGSLGYRAKYSHEFKIEKEEPNDFCDFCGCMFVLCEFVGTDRPPDYEFSGLVNYLEWKPLETIAQAVDRKNALKERFGKKFELPNLSERYWNVDCMNAVKKVEVLVKRLSV